MRKGLKGLSLKVDFHIIHTRPSPVQDHLPCQDARLAGQARPRTKTTQFLKLCTLFQNIYLKLPQKPTRNSTSHSRLSRNRLGACQGDYLPDLQVHSQIILEYAAPVWSPAISDTNWDKLQSVQNLAACYFPGHPGCEYLT